LQLAACCLLLGSDKQVDGSRSPLLLRQRQQPLNISATIIRAALEDSAEFKGDLTIL
jgi:hypothetical protein